MNEVSLTSVKCLERSIQVLVLLLFLFHMMFINLTWIHSHFVHFIYICKQHFWSVWGGGGGGERGSWGCSHRLRHLSKRVPFFLQNVQSNFIWGWTYFWMDLIIKMIVADSCICVYVGGGGGGLHVWCEGVVTLLFPGLFHDIFQAEVCLSEILCTWTLWHFDWDKNKIAGLMVMQSFAGLPFVLLLWFFFWGGGVDWLNAWKELFTSPFSFFLFFSSVFFVVL